MWSVIILAIAILMIAMLYASVGHAGASGYLAAMAIVTTMPQEDMKAVALTLNLFVGGIGTYHFVRAGHFDWPTFWPFAIAAVPMAFLGGWWTLPAMVFQPLIGVVLLYAAVALMLHRRKAEPHTPTSTTALPPWPIALACGGVLGLLAGLTGTGGGIFLSPLLLMMHWASPQRTAAVTIVFVFANSLAGFGGVLAEAPHLPAALPIYIATALVGGLIGAHMGARVLPGHGIRLLLSAVLVIAAVKMFITTAA